MSNIVELLKTKSSIELMDDIALGKDSFQDGVFQLYINEAKDRGLSIDDSAFENLIKEAKVKSADEIGNMNVFLGFILMFVFGAIFCFVPGLELIKKDSERKYIHHHSHVGLGKFFIGVSVTVIFLGCLYGLSKIVFKF